MKTSEVTVEDLRSSVISVPPLARTAAGDLCPTNNAKIVRHLEEGGVSTLLYGGNAALYHVACSEYEDLLSLLAEVASADSWVIPSVGPMYGTMMDQAAILKDFPFPTAMILPTRDAATSVGVGRAVRKFVETNGRPAVLYIKHDGYIDVDTVSGLMGDGLISFIKYAVVRNNPADDPYLQDLIDTIGPSRIISGIGEQPAIDHVLGFGVSGFTSGCVCVAPGLSTRMLRALQSGDTMESEKIRATFRPLEDLRNEINPVRVLHAAVRLADIAETGPLLPLFSEVDVAHHPAIEAASRELLAADRQQAVS